jgi:hypothetical protein
MLPTAVPRPGGRPPDVHTTSNFERGRLDPVGGSTTVVEAPVTVVDGVSVEGAEKTDVVTEGASAD